MGGRESRSVKEMMTKHLAPIEDAPIKEFGSEGPSAPQLLDKGKVFVAGVLRKLRDETQIQMASWHIVYGVVDEERFYYYEDVTSEQPLGSISLQGCNQVKRVNKCDGSVNSAFAVCRPEGNGRSREYTFATLSTTELTGWMTKLNDAMILANKEKVDQTLLQAAVSKSKDSMPRPRQPTPPVSDREREMSNIDEPLYQDEDIFASFDEPDETEYSCDTDDNGGTAGTSLQPEAVSSNLQQNPNPSTTSDALELRGNTNTKVKFILPEGLPSMIPALGGVRRGPGTKIILKGNKNSQVFMEPRDSVEPSPLNSREGITIIGNKKMQLFSGGGGGGSSENNANDSTDEGNGTSDAIAQSQGTKIVLEGNEDAQICMVPRDSVEPSPLTSGEEITIKGNKKMQLFSGGGGGGGSSENNASDSTDESNGTSDEIAQGQGTCTAPKVSEIKQESSVLHKGSRVPGGVSVFPTESKPHVPPKPLTFKGSTLRRPKTLMTFGFSTAQPMSPLSDRAREISITEETLYEDVYCCASFDEPDDFKDLYDSDGTCTAPKVSELNQDTSVLHKGSRVPRGASVFPPKSKTHLLLEPPTSKGSTLPPPTTQKTSDFSTGALKECPDRGTYLIRNSSSNEPSVQRLWKDVDTSVTDRASASSANLVDDTSSAATFSISKLVPVLTKEMDRYMSRFSNFSYQFGWKGELTAYVSDLSNDAMDDLKKELEKQLRQHIPEEHVKVTVVSRLPMIALCCGGIGTTLNVGDDSQLVGMYLQYDGAGTIFWVSSAHGLLRVSDGGHLRAATTAALPPQIETTRRIRSRFSACLDLRSVELPVPYVVFQYNGVVISHNQDVLRKFCTEHSRERAIQKPMLCHSVDIMIGPTPLTNWHLRGPRALPYALQLTSAVDGCGRPPLCSLACHASTKQFYRITGIRQFDILSTENISSFDMSDLRSHRLISYLGGNDQLAKGTVCSIPCNCYRLIAARHEYVLQNVIVIQPTEDSCRPRRGHSGSVWVQQRGNDWEAVAITCAVIICPENPAVEMWLAAPLCACLLALSEEYPHVFDDYSKFTVLA